MKVVPAITCQEFESILPTYQNGGCCEEIREAAQQHIAACAACADLIFENSRVKKRRNRKEFLKAFGLFGAILFACILVFVIIYFVIL